jgi:hypothetical protein
MMHAYDALGKLGGDGTTILLGDFAHIPNFLFPSVAGFHNPFSGPSPSGGAAPSADAGTHKSAKHVMTASAP